MDLMNLSPDAVAEFKVQTDNFSAEYGRAGGAIINVASDAAKTATPGEAMIGAAKAAIVMFTRTIAIEEKRHGIRANALTPSLVHGTASTERITTGEGFSAKLFAQVESMASLGVCTPDDLAAMIVYLGGPQAGRRIRQDDG